MAAIEYRRVDTAGGVTRDDTVAIFARWRRRNKAAVLEPGELDSSGI